MGLALLVDGDLYLVLIGRNLFLRLFEVWIVAVGTWLHLVEVELYVGGIGTAAVLVGHFLDLDGLACHIVVLLLLGQFLLEIGVESAEWAEGNYVEPDLKFGHGYLDALKDAIIDE